VRRLGLATLLGLLACAPEPARTFEIVRPLTPFDCLPVFRRRNHGPDPVQVVGERLQFETEFMTHLECPQGVIKPDSVVAEVFDADGQPVSAASRVDIQFTPATPALGASYSAFLGLEFDVPDTTELRIRVQAEPTIGVATISMGVVSLVRRAWERVAEPGTNVVGLLEGPSGWGPIPLDGEGLVLPSGERAPGSVFAVTSTDVWAFGNGRRTRWRPDAGLASWPTPDCFRVSALGSSVAVFDREGLAVITEDGGRTAVISGQEFFDGIHFSAPDLITVSRGGQVDRVNLAQPQLPPPALRPVFGLSSPEGLWLESPEGLALVQADGGMLVAGHVPGGAFLPSRVTHDQVPLYGLRLGANRWAAAVPLVREGRLMLEVIDVPAGLLPESASTRWVFARGVSSDQAGSLWRAPRRP
jgi:hypothetical protein